MQSLKIDATRYTPEIILDASGYISIKGKSYPENTFEFYQPIMEWLGIYFKIAPAEKTLVDIEIIYFNSSSSQLFSELFDLLEEAVKNRHEIEVNWIFDKDNENAQEFGEDFKEDFEVLHINLICKSD